MDLSKRLELRDLVLGEDHARRELRAFVAGDHAASDVARLVAHVAPLIARLDQAVNDHLPYGTAREAVDSFGPPPAVAVS